MLAVTATVTEAMKEDIIVKLDMVGCSTVSVSPNKPNIYYEVLRKSTIESVVKDLETNRIHARRILFYCQSVVLSVVCPFPLHVG